MSTKIMGAITAVMLVVAATLALQLHGAREDVSSLTSARDGALTALGNAQDAQRRAEAQNANLAGALAVLDGRLTRMADDQKANSALLAKQIAKLRDIQKTEGDSDETILCLDTRVPVQLDQWMRDDSAGANDSDRVPERIPSGGAPR